MSEVLEALIVLFMFVIRIGLPIAVTLAFGLWLEKRLRPQQEPLPDRFRIEPAHALQASKLSGPHCWDVHHCDASKRALCAATRHPDLPCWLALQVEGIKVREQCFTCGFYKPQALAA